MKTKGIKMGISKKIEDMNLLKMKYILLVLLTFGFFSCNNFLEEDLSSKLTPDGDALANVNGLKSALAGAYHSYMHSWNSGFANSATQAYMMGGDDLTTHKSSNKADFREFDQYKISNTNARLTYIWKGVYKSIQACNNIIANWENATGDKATINQIAGEAYFLRAYNYFWVARFWGNAPLVLETHVWDPDILSISRTPVAQVYDQILKDLEKAIPLMQDKKPSVGRAGAGTAKAILAEVYLQMAGWPVKDNSKYALAASTAKELIDNRSKYGFELMPAFSDLWVTATQNKDGNSEEVFALTFSGVGWNQNNMYGSAARPGDEGGWDDFFAEITFFEEFPLGPRKNATFQTVLRTNPNTSWQNFAVKHPYYLKFQGDKGTHMNTHSLPLERFAEVYFIFAEAQIMATGNKQDPAALEAVNKIRRRAAGKALNTPDPSIDLTSATQWDIVTEKGWEFAGEFCRWFDLTRLERVQDVVIKKNAEELKPQPEGRGPITTADYFLPLPNSETQANPNL